MRKKRKHINWLFCNKSYLILLDFREGTISDIFKVIDISYTQLLYHISVLESHKLIKSSNKGTRGYIRVYSLTDKGILIRKELVEICKRLDIY